MNSLRQLRHHAPARGIATTVVVGAVGVVVLLFVRSALPEGVDASRRSAGAWPTVLAALSAAGAFAGFLAAFAMRRVGGPRLVAAGSAMIGIAATFAAIVFRNGLDSPQVLLVIAGLTGAGIGLATVALSSSLRAAVEGRFLALCVGCGIALAQLVCALPAVVDATTVAKCWITAGVALVGTLATMLTDRSHAPATSRTEQGLPADLPERVFTRVGIAATAAVFVALSGFAALTGATAPGPAENFWEVGAAPAAAAIVAGWSIDRGWFRVVPAAALAALIVAAHEVAPVLRAPGLAMGAVALVCFAALGRSRSHLPARVWRAAWPWGVAAWIAPTLAGLLVEETPPWATPAAIVLLAGSLLILGVIRTPDANADR